MGFGIFGAVSAGFDGPKGPLAPCSTGPRNSSPSGSKWPTKWPTVHPSPHAIGSSGALTVGRKGLRRRVPYLASAMTRYAPGASRRKLPAPVSHSEASGFTPRLYLTLALKVTVSLCRHPPTLHDYTQKGDRMSELRHDVLCGCGWGRLAMLESDIPEHCPLCGATLLQGCEDPDDLDPDD